MVIPTSSSLAIDASDIARRFGASWVLRGVTLRLSPGEVVGVLGVNGSGKSTFLRILATLIKPHAGTALVCGHDIAREPEEVRAQIGYLAHTPGLYDDLTARENLIFAAAMLDRDERGVDAILERVGLLAYASQPVRGFSSGMQRRLAIGRLMLIRPKVLLLDEPYSNLDSGGLDLMNSLISEWVDAGAAALVVLHELAPAADLLDRTVTLQDGRAATKPAMHSDPAGIPLAASGR
ncbi:MAG TPA: heme ABC exporter ATP-binding protein CcmA [Gemmatimonadaceae bacterium]|nr:heme ABC exporter ATP-binding protein CcmA [Gemmatimonadaceae bacterium]